jgi:hypothetical protein
MTAKQNTSTRPAPKPAALPYKLRKATPRAIAKAHKQLDEIFASEDLLGKSVVFTTLDLVAARRPHGIK